MFFENHTIVNLLPSNENSKNKKSVSLNINNISEILNEGDILKLDFDSAVVQIIKCNNDEAQARVISPGVIRSNKGISCDRVLKIPAFSKKDLEIIKIAKKLNQKNIFLSFCSSGEDILFLRDKFNYDVNVISKIESKKATLFSIDQICEQSNGVLIDRGDLSRDVPLEKDNPCTKIYNGFWKKIFHSSICCYKSNGKYASKFKAYQSRGPRYCASTLEQGAQGLVLVAETAIGNYPVEAVRIMSRIIKENLGNDRIKTESKSSVDFLTMPPTGRIIEPHGGKLINQYCTIKDSSKMASLAISDELSTDVINICNGTFSPISKFMNLDEINSVFKK